MHKIIHEISKVKILICTLRAKNKPETDWFPG